MLEWGPVRFPELENRTIDLDSKKPQPKPGLVHLPTGMRMTWPVCMYHRGEHRVYALHSPPDEDWQVSIRIYGWLLLRERLKRHYVDIDFAKTSFSEELSLEEEFIPKFGHEYICNKIAPEPGSGMPDWTEKRRAAAIMLLFYYLEAPLPQQKDNRPYPSTMKFVRDVPDLFLGTYQSPAWERL